MSARNEILSRVRGALADVVQPDPALDVPIDWQYGRPTPMPVSYTHLDVYKRQILNDPLYPVVLPVAPDDFRAPLQLVARRLSFLDPIDQAPRDYTSRFALPWPEPAR